MILRQTWRPPLPSPPLTNIINGKPMGWVFTYKRQASSFSCIHDFGRRQDTGNLGIFCNALETSQAMLHSQGVKRGSGNC